MPPTPRPSEVDADVRRRPQVLREAGCALVVHDFEDPRMWEELSGWEGFH